MHKLCRVLICHVSWSCFSDRYFVAAKYEEVRKCLVCLCTHNSSFTPLYPSIFIKTFPYIRHLKQLWQKGMSSLNRSYTICGRVFVSCESLVNLASGAVVECSSFNIDHNCPCEGAIDGQVPSDTSIEDGTQWTGNIYMGGVDSHWILLNFASERIVFRLELYHRCIQATQCSEIDVTCGDASIIRVTT